MFGNDFGVRDFIFLFGRSRSGMVRKDGLTLIIQNAW